MAKANGKAIIPKTTSSAALVGRDDLVDKLANKVRNQAAILEDLQSDVEERKMYARLCEQFVITLEPSQPLPLAKEDLAALRARQTRAHVQDGAFVNRSSRHTLTTIARQYESACKRINEQGEKIAELEAELARGNDAREVSARRVAALRKKLGEAQSRILQLRRGAPAAVAVTSEELEALQSRVADLEQDKHKLTSSLEKESRATEEQRVYIDVLQSALKARAEELGLDPESVHAAEKAKFDVLAAKTSIARLERNEAELRETVGVLQERLRLEGMRLQQARRRLSLYEPVDGDSNGDSPGNEGVDDDDLDAALLEDETKGGDRLRLRRPSSGGAREDGRNVHHLQATNRKLQKENEALLDFVRETVEPLKAEKAELEETLEATAASLDNARKDQHDLQKHLASVQQALEEANLKTAQANVECSAAHEACAAAEEERDLARTQLDNTTLDLERTRASLESQRAASKELGEELKAAKARSGEADDLAQQLLDTQNTLRCERRELVVVEEKRSVLEAQVSQLEVARLDLKDRAGKLQAERTRLENEVAALERALETAKVEAGGHKAACDTLREERQGLDEELKELRLFKRKAWRIEKAIATLWHEGASPEVGLANLHDILQRVSAVAMGGAEEDASLTVMSLLENIMPHLNALLFSAQSLVARAHTDGERMRKDLAGQDERFQTEKRLLHDEIHALRQKFQRVEELQAETQRLTESRIGGARGEDAVGELDRLRRSHADLEAKCAALELRVHEAEHLVAEPGLGAEAVDDAGKTARNMRSRLEQATEHADHVMALKQDLEKAAVLMREQEEVTQQLEAQLVDAEDQLKDVQQDGDMARRLVAATLKSIFVRYRTAHGAVQEFFSESGAPERDLSDRSMEDAVTPLCEILEAVLEHDTVAYGSTTGAPAARHAAPRPRSTQALSARQRERARVARIEALNESLSRAQQAVDDTRAQLQSELGREAPRPPPAAAHTRSFATASSIGLRSRLDDDDEDFDGSRRAFWVPEDIGRDGEGEDDVDEIIVRRARSPSRVRVARDGSVQIDAMMRPRSGRRSSADLGSSLRDAARMVDQVDRIRKSTARQDTPQSRRYKQQLKAAQDKFRRLSSFDK